ncbi:hypothetical protein LOZ00_002063, partial [Ophidiomyces ophidiicola]
MKLYQSVAVLWLLVVHQASATLWGLGLLGAGLSFFNTPMKTENVCTPGQQKGYDWGDVKLGGFDFFDDFNFSGFTCKSVFDLKKWVGKFQDKCIEGVLDKTLSLAPKIIAAKKKGFSIDTMQITVEKDVDVGFEYTMPGGQICKEIHPCSPGGSIIKNTQCGGATSVSIFLPVFAKLAKCKIAIHKILFQCGPPQFTRTVITSLPPPSTTKVIVTPPGSTPPVSTPGSTPPGSTPGSTPPGSVPGSTPPGSTPGSTPPGSTPGSTPPGSTPGSTPPVSVPGSTPPVSPPGSTPPGTPTTPPSTTIILPGPSSTISVPGKNTSIIVPGTSITSIIPGPSTPIVVPTPSISMSTSTVFTTSLVTVTSCAPSIPNCPAESKTPIVVTSTIAISTTLCPVTVTPGVPTPGQPGQPGQPTPGQPGQPGQSSPGPNQPS